MNTKPLSTSFEDFSAEEIEAMGNDEMLARSIHTSGDLGTMLQGIALEASQEILHAIQMGRLLAEAFKDVDENASKDLSPMVGEQILGAILAAMAVAREAERFHVANPEFPDTDPADAIMAALNGAASESV